MGKVPCLLPELKSWRELWQAQLAVIHQQAELAITDLEGECRKPGLLPATRARLQQQRDGQQGFLRDLDDVLIPAVGKPLLRPSLDRHFQPLKSVHLLHRDWGWPDSDENRRALACVEQVVSAPLGRLLVIGAGSCRLAHDLHVRHGAAATVALDIDPLTLSVAEKVIAGGSVPLTETRVDALTLDGVYALRTLKAPEGNAAGAAAARENLHVLLADGLHPPLREHIFDTVLTPWFIDQVPTDVRDFLGALRRMLAPGGRWLNFGPLIYPTERPGACRFTREELFDLARRAGFDIERTASESLPYSVSPLTARGKLEHCLAFCARAIEPPVDAPGELPSWIVLPYLPVPDFPERAGLQHESAAVAAIMGLVDGARGINDIVAAFEAATGVRRPAMDDTVRHCLIEAHPDCRRSPQ